MLDIRLLREQTDDVKAQLGRVGVEPAAVDAVLAYDEQRRTLLKEVEALKATRNAVSKEIGKMKDAAARDTKIAEMRGVGDRIAELDRQVDGRQDRLNGGGVDRAALEGAVEVDDVQPFEALRRKGRGLRGRVAVEDRGAVHGALLEADATAVLQVDRGKEDHGAQLRKFVMSFSPSFWLFSGWNCVPATLPCATIAVTGPPWSVRASTSCGRAAASA